MSKHDSKLPSSQTETPSLSEEKKPKTPLEDKNPTSFKEDPDYQRLKDELNTRWLARTGVKSLSGDHQDYLFGNPADRNATTLEQDTESAFREQFTDRAVAYDEHERVRAYDKMSDDPAYRALQEQITVRTNMDSQVRAASKSGRDVGDTWDRINMREHLHGMNNFARQYPEKAQAYGERWDTFVKEHTEVADMNTAEWQAWCSDHPGAFASMSEYRNVARAVEHVKRRQEINTIQPEVQTSETKLDEIRERLGVEKPQSTNTVETPLKRQRERLNQLQLEDVASAIRTSIPVEVQSADRAALETMQKELAALPYVPGNDMRTILDSDGEDEGVMMVNTDAIVGSVSPAFQNWSTEYDDREGRIVDIAHELIKGTPEAVDHVFHVTDPDHGVILKKISGPGGDLFFVVDGTHRVAGSKLVQLPDLPAQVENMTELSEVRTTDPMLRSQWEQRINRGLIQGSIEETRTPSGQKSFNLKIESQVLPWMNLPQHQLIKMTKFYFERYPNALNDMKSLKTGEKIPREALFDGVALNFYLADRWDAYQPKE